MTRELTYNLKDECGDPLKLQLNEDGIFLSVTIRHDTTFERTADAKLTADTADALADVLKAYALTLRIIGVRS